MVTISKKEQLGNSTSRQIRLQILDALYQAKGGHFGGACSCVEILQALLVHGSISQRGASQDIFILSKGHAAVSYYASLNALGLAQLDLSNYGNSITGTEIHPCIHANNWVHFSTGSLGQGLSYGLGSALALANEPNRHVWVVMGDGECQEGQVWEAAMLASRYQLTNLHVILDLNRHQECGWEAQEVAHNVPLPAAEEKWRAFGWQVESLNGHCLTSLRSWIEASKTRTLQPLDPKQPNIAIANTVKGAGIPCFEQQPALSHCTTLSREHYHASRNFLAEAC
ncbi:thiamine pyrophosphate-dependent enzyme [Agaribacterium sp. ZY112]|uniref:thiamine pyrophosphate-dependent enzyme n=1 Tax=Agaribacterium sp. ZY112 TaxID=3233574 RepID=UPI00352516A6